MAYFAKIDEDPWNCYRRGDIFRSFGVAFSL
jgi:hypothetical protein